MAPPDRTRKGLRWSRESDGAVAVVIGALLTFIIVVTLVGTYVLWYVPSNGDQLDIQYLSNTENSFLRMQDQVGNSTPFPGEFVTQNFMLGVAGTPPFSGSTDSAMGYSNDSSYRTALNYSLVVNVTYSHVNRSIVLNINFNGTGLISLTTDTPFIPSMGFYYQNDVIATEQEGTNYSQILGNLPFSVAANSSGLLLHASEFSVSGNNTTVGGYGSSLLTMQFSKTNQSDFFKGENVTVSNQTGGFTSAIVDNMSLRSFNYSITSPLVSSWNTTLSSLYAGSGTSHGNESTGITWNFSKFNFSVFLKGHTLSISMHTGTPLKPYSVELNYFVLRLLQI
jgi:hypothetical protein